MLENLYTQVSNSINKWIYDLPFEDRNFLYMLFGFLSIIIFLTMVLIFYLIYKEKQKNTVLGKLKDYNESFYKQAQEEFQKNNMTKSLYEYIDLLLVRGQIKNNYRFNFMSFITLTILFLLFGLYTFIDIFEDYLISFAMGIAFAVIPYMTLELYTAIKSHKIKNQILTIPAILIQNVKAANGDVYIAIKKTSERSYEPLKGYLQDFCNEYESGVDIPVCFNNLREKVSDYRFKKIVNTLECHLKKGGNAAISLHSISRELDAIEIQENNKKKTHFANVIGVYFMVASNIGLIYFAGDAIPGLMNQLKGDDYRFYIFIAIINILISLFIAFKSTRIRVKQK
ncbi:MAG: type II secretion system F family protein [Candidatus Woesearchaeota archaeon]